MDIKVAVIADGTAVPRFGLEALNALAGCDRVTVFACTNTRFTRKPVRHGAYYLLNLFTVRNRWSRPVPIGSGSKRVERVVEFESGWEGAWQTLPDAVVDALREGGFDVAIKFGMGLLRIPPAERLPVPILSYHHGDPDHFRGRPAGFWETMAGRPVMGQIVQVLSNRLDAGRVVAFAETRVLPYSYRGTLAEAYRHSSLLINEAVRNATAGTYLPKPCQGKNYRLPSNADVVRFAARTSWQAIRRVAYGAALEKKWEVSLAGCGREALDEVVRGAAFPAPERWRTIPVGPRYAFYADPFFSDAPGAILVEALNRRSGLGELVLVEGDRHRQVSDGRGHYSYPSTIDVDGRQLILPEICQWSSTRLFELAGDRLSEVAPLRVAGDPRIADPTLIAHEGRFYLFGSPVAYGTNVLGLWSAACLDDLFELHPLSPVRISPQGGRMAGALLRLEGRLIRFGQSFERYYGDGIVAFEIEALSAQTYRERRIGEIRFGGDRIGPHTLNARDGELVFDWYRHKPDLLAGARRLVARLRGGSTLPAR
ncbi:MAG TPA: hypothetical protein VF547_09845 [Allosphingosinicella sp.]|jgi:hypothetical protein